MSADACALQPAAVSPAAQAAAAKGAGMLAAHRNSGGMARSQPGAALAAYSSAAPVVAAATPDNVCMGAACMGGAFTLLTLLLTARFLLSFFPRLERQALARQWPYSAVTVLDPVLQPVKRHLFALEETDPDYAAVAVLAVATGLLECLVGEYGLLVHAIPDFQLVRALQQLIIVQHCFLLPSWCLVVLRWASVM